MDKNRFEGTARDVGGKIQDTVGSLTEDAGTRNDEPSCGASPNHL
jgi:uncharacterized protein YjbJ (UPF0337 family)